MQLEGKRALITGAATGIGRATALLFAREGASVAILDIADDGATRTVNDIEAAGGSAWFAHADVSVADQVRDGVQGAVDHLGGLDICVNNAGRQRSGAVTEFAEEDWDAVMDLNPRSCFLCAKYAVPHLRSGNGPAIVNTSSLAGLKGGPGMTGYSASKGAIIAFSRALAAELATDGIRVNCVCPGWIDTPFNAPAAEFMGGSDRLVENVAGMVPLGRQGTPDEIAPAFCYLASDAASYLTGQVLTIDGGLF